MVKHKKLLTIIVVFYNGEREARRTLYSLSTDYQRNISQEEYDVIVLDNGSQKPLDARMVKKFGTQFQYKYIDTKSPSPCGAITDALEQVKTPYVMCLIDGAHILSPGVLRHSLTAAAAFSNPCVHTIPLHLGDQVQNDNMVNGYNQEVEDELLKTITWKENGYALFSISNIAVSMNGFFGRLIESNCFLTKTKTLQEKGGFDKRFVSSGGGLVNLDIFKNMVEDSNVQPVVLIGEASFHQFHGGVSTNVLRKEHPLPGYKEEYKTIRHKKYQRPDYKAFYFGHIPEECQQQTFKPATKVIIELGRRFLKEKKTKEAVAVFQQAKKMQPYAPNVFIDIGTAQEQNGNLKAAADNYRQAIAINPLTHAYYYLKLGNVLLSQGEQKVAFDNFQQAFNIDAEDAKVHLMIGKAHHKTGNPQKAKAAFAQALKYLKAYPAMNIGAYILHGRTLFELKDERALTVFNLGLQQFSNDPRLLIWRGRVFMRQGKPAKAEVIFKTALAQQNVNTTQLSKILGTLYMRQKRWKEAILFLEKAKKGNPNDRQLYVLLGECRGRL